MKVRLAYGRDRAGHRRRPDADHGGRARAPRGRARPDGRTARGAAPAGRRAAAARAGPPRADGGHLGLRRHPPAAAAPDDPRDPRRARRASSTSTTWSSWSPPAPIAATPRPNCARCSATRSSTPCGSSTTTPATATRSPGSARYGDDVPGLAEPRVGRGGRPDHHRFRRAALLRGVLRRPEAGRARAGRAGDRARPARRGAHRRPAAPPGASSRATRSTTTCGPSPRPPGSPSRST